MVLIEHCLGADANGIRSDRPTPEQGAAADFAALARHFNLNSPQPQPQPSPAPDVLHVNGHVIGGAFKTLWESTPRSYQAFGNPLSEETTAQVTDVSADGVDAHSVTRTRTVQFFERAIFIYQPEQPADWQAVCALTTQLIDTP
jgi:hypothetical protein